MKMRPVLKLALLARVLFCLGGAVSAQSPWPDITLDVLSTHAAGVEQIAYGNGLFLAVGGSFHHPPGGITATSPDGFHWTAHSLSSNAIVGYISSVAAGSNNFVAVGNPGTYYGDPAGNNGLIELSSDGLVWGPPVIIPSVPLGGVAYANGVYVAVGRIEYDAAIVTSSDGVSWSTSRFSGYGPLRAVTTGGGLFVAVGNSGAIFTSTNGLRWLRQVGLPGANITSVAYGKGTFVAGAPEGDAAYVLTSTNGTNWVAVPSRPLGSITYGNGLFVGISGGISASTNGVDWMVIWPRPGAEVDLEGVAYGAGTFNVLFGLGLLFNISPRAFLGWSAQTNGVVDLTLTGGWAGQSCRLQAATNLSANNWIDLLTFTNQGSVTHLQDAGAGNYPRRFYRVAMP